jgi:hypothetical protein
MLLLFSIKLLARILGIDSFVDGEYHFLVGDLNLQVKFLGKKNLPN